MKIAYNPKTAAALTTAPENNDITFDLRGLNIFVRGERFKGTDTTYSVFKKHTSDSGGGYNGLVPVPSYTATNIRFLREDGTWSIPAVHATFIYTQLTNQDLDDYLEEGKWYYAGGGNSVTNKPIGVDAFELYVGRNARDYRYQKLITYSGIIWFRYYDSTAWKTWVRWYTDQNTDQKVLQSADTTANFRPVILGYTNTNTPSDLSANVTQQVYTTTTIYAQPSTGSIWANELYSGGKPVLTEHQSLANYVTLDTAQAITGVKTFFAGPILDSTVTITQHQNSTSNYTKAIMWLKGGTSQGTHNPSIGQHNTGGDGTGSICILPYPTSTDPWNGTVGLFISKGVLRLDGKSIALAENYYTKTESDARYVNVTGDTMTGPLIVTATITGTQLVSTIDTGTSPLKVTSATVVANLNSDFLDGFHEISFFRARGSQTIANSTPTTTELSSDNNLSGSWWVNYPGAQGHLVQFNARAGSTKYMQFYSNYNSSLYWRNSTDSTISSKPWRTIVDSSNYTGIVLKIGTATRGSGSLPIYLNAGVPTVCGTTLGVSITGNAVTATKLQTARTINGTSFNGTANITTANWGATRTITLSGAVTGSASVNGSQNVTITTTYQTGSIDERYVGGNKTASHGSAGTAYTADTYSSNFVNKAFVAFAERGSWYYAGNGYVTTDTGVNIPLAGTAVFQWGANDTYKTQLFITPYNNSGVSNPAANEMLFYTSNGSGYTSAWTRVLTHRNYTSYTVTKTGGGASGTWGISITGNALTATAAQYIVANNRMDYGWNGLNYFNIYGTAGTAVKVNNTPTSTWWHILRFNHANLDGYYTDLAVPFLDNSLYYKRVQAGALMNGKWVRILDELNYTGVTDGRYVKKSGDTMTGKLTISHASTESMIINSTNSTETYIRVQNAGASKSCFGWHNNASVGTYMYSSACNKYLGIMDNGTPYFNGSTIWHAGNDGSGSGLDADLLDGRHASDFYGNGYVMFKFTIDASSLNQNTYYPVTFSIGNHSTVRIECIVSLNSGTKPSWSTHNSGFSVRKIWEVNGLGWGTSAIDRRILVSDYNWATEDPVRGIGQLTNASTEYVYVRGGGKYFFYVSHNCAPTLRTSTYTVSSQSVSPTTSAPGAIQTPTLAFAAGRFSALSYKPTTGVNTVYIPTNTSHLTNDSGFWTGTKYWANIAVSASSSTGTTPTFNTCYTSNWFRSTGSTGWYSESYRGGWYMTDTTYIRAYGDKRVYTANPEQYAFYTAGGMTAAKGFWHNAVNSNSYVLLAGGSYKGLGDFAKGNAGSETKGVYVTNGTVTAMTYALNSNLTSGTSGKLAYYNSNTVVAAYSSSVGATNRGVYMNAGVPTVMTYSLNATVNSGTSGKLAYYSGTNAISSSSNTVGSSTTPIYLNAGSLTACTGVMVKYWAVYNINNYNTSSVTYSKKAGNHNFVTSVSRRSEGRYTIGTVYPSGQTWYTTFVWAVGNLNKNTPSNSTNSLLYCTLIRGYSSGSTYYWYANTSDDASTNDGSFDLFFLCF